MGWHFRSPDAFPAYFKQKLLEASLETGAPIILASDRSFDQVAAIAEQFRWYRWCIRQPRNLDAGLRDVIENMDVRTKIENDGISHILFITINPTKVSEFIRLNPELARSVL